MKTRVICFVVVAMVMNVQAETISLNFGANTAALSLDASDQAGSVGNETGNTVGSTLVGNWNNLSGNTGSNIGNLTHSGGDVVDGVTVSWSANNTFALPDTTSGLNDSANTTMMKGYLDNDLEGTTEITLSGLAALGSSYSVIVYTDGDNQGIWRLGTYVIGGTSITAEDSEGVDFNDGAGNNANGIFQIPVADGTGNQNWPSSPNNSEGNMLIFTGLTDASFTLTATPGVSENMDFQRAVINGIQVVGVIPEPATMGLIATFGGGLLLVRRIFLI